MADFPELPAYLQPRHENPEPWIMSAMQFGAQQAQKQREFGLEVDRFHVQQQQANLTMAHQAMQNQMQLDEMDDSAKLQPWLMELNKGNFDAPLPDGLKTYKAATSAIKMRELLKKQSAEGAAEQAITSDYVDVLKHTPSAAADFAQFKPFSPEWISTVDRWKKYVDVDKANQKFLMDQAEAEMKQKAEQTRQQNVLNTRSENYLAGIDAKGMWGAYQKNLGGRAPNRDTFVRDTAKELRFKDPKLSVDDSIKHANAIFDQQISPVAAPTAAPATSPDSDPLGLFK